MSLGVICIVSIGLAMLVRFVVAGYIIELFRANYRLRLSLCKKEIVMLMWAIQASYI